jgi:hypothetical protein
VERSCSVRVTGRVPVRTLPWGSYHKVALADAIRVADGQHGVGGGVEPRRGEKSERRENISYAPRLSFCSLNLFYSLLRRLSFLGSQQVDDQ